MRRVAAAALAALTVSGAAWAASEPFLTRFDGRWAGSGQVQPNMDSATHKVSCSATGATGETEVSINGTCTTAIIVSRKVGANLRLDPATGTYSGTYVGSDAGPAQLVGKRDGDALRLKVTWPKVINGDRHASMTITNPAGKSFRVHITDRLGTDGPLKTTTELSFTRK